MVEISGGKIPNSNLYMYQIFSNRGQKFWGTEILEVIGTIIDGVIEFDCPHSIEEAEEALQIWRVKSITDKF